MSASGKTGGGLLATGLAVALAAGVLSGCGGDKDDSSTAPIARAIGTTTSVPSARATPAVVPFSGQTSAEIVQNAADAMDGLHTATVDVTSLQDGEHVRMRMGMTAAGDCAGHVVAGGGNIEMIGKGKAMYMSGDRAGWIALDGAKEGAAIDTLLKGRWVKVPASEADLEDYCDLHAYVAELTTTSDPQEMATGAPTTLDGRGVVPLSGPVDDGSTETLYIATKGHPYILKAVGSGSDGDTEVLSDFDKPLPVNAPPPSRTLDLSSLHKANGDGFSI